MSEKDKLEVKNDLKDPLLGTDNQLSPAPSDQGSVEIPHYNKVAQARLDDLGAGGPSSYAAPSKTETQAQLDSFLIYFGESAAHNKRNDGEKGRPTDEESELSDSTAMKYVSPNRGKQKTTTEQLQKMLVSFNAPDDATKCVKVESLQNYIKNEAKLIKNPRSAYFDLSRRYYKAKYDDDNKVVIEVESFLHTKDEKNYLRYLSLDIIQTQQGNMPIVKTYEENAYDSSNFVKALKFYDYKRDGKLLAQYKVDDGVMDETYRTFDISTLHWQNYVIFYVRFEKWLQLKKYDVIENKEEEIPNYQIEMPFAKDIRYHPIFSQEFGQKKQNVVEKSGSTQTLNEFLDSQFVFCQEYKISDKQVHETMGFQMFSMADTNTPIKQYGVSEMKPLNEAIQKIAHIKQYNEKGLYYTFVALDPFSSLIFTCEEKMYWYSEPVVYPGNNEYQLQKNRVHQLSDPNMSSQEKHDNLRPFLIHENPQFLIQKDQVRLNIVDDDLVVDQYYYMTNDNQFMLVYPNYTDLRQKNDVIFQLAQRHSYNVVNDDDYEYIDDYEQRIQDYELCKYKKIAHVCHDSYRSKNHMKRSKHLRDIIEYPIEFRMNHRLILSTDQERSNIYVYMSTKAKGKNFIEIYNYENNIDKAVPLRPRPKRQMVDGEEEEIHQIPKLPKQVQNVMNEEVRYGKRIVEDEAKKREDAKKKVVEEDAQCYYLNGLYKNVVSSKYCIKTQSKSLVDQRCHEHALPPTESKFFCLVEGGAKPVDKKGKPTSSGTAAQYYNIRIKHDNVNKQMAEEVELQMYYRSKQYYLFLFKLVTSSQKEDWKYSFFFIRQTYNQVEELSLNNGNSLIYNDQDIYLVKENDLLGPEEFVLSKYLQRLKYSQLIQLHQDGSEKQQKLHLTCETLYDMRKRYEFLPFIYQDQRSMASHNLLVLDINSMTIAGKTSINSNLVIREYLRKSVAGFAIYTLTRTSDIYDQKIGIIDKMRGNAADACSQVTKLQITHQYHLENEDAASNPARCTLEFSEFLCHFNNQSATSTKTQMIGRKQMLLSDVAQYRREQTFDKLFVLPYYDKYGKVKGSQLILKEDDQVIKILDQDKNKIYHQETEMLQFGQQRFLTDKHSHDEYLLLVSAQFRQKIYMKGNLDTSEAYYILCKIQKKIMSMQLAKFEYFVLTDDFDKLMREEFYQAQEVLQGKMVCDICLNFPKEIATGLRLNEKQFQQIDGSLIDEICLGKLDQIDFYKRIGFCEDNLIIQPDFNFVTTLRLAVELGANQSVKMILHHIFELNKRDYQEVLMLDLPKLLDDDLVKRIYPFLERDHDEMMQLEEDMEDIDEMEPGEQKAQFCNFEDFIINPDLPPFASEKMSYHVMSNFIDYHNVEQELLCEVLLKDPNMMQEHSLQDEVAASKKAKYEVEHSLIDFQKLIVGEKIRGFQESFKNVEFNDQHLAQILHKEGEENLHFYQLETVQKLVEFQFLKTSQFLNLILKLYLGGFLLPFIFSITVENFLLQNLCYIFCFVTQCFLIFFELVQMKQYGLEYIQDVWNCIDLFQFSAFMYLFINKLITQFQSDSFMEILFSALVLFLSVYKIMYFVRVYDQYNETLTIIHAITIDMLPFAAVCLALLFSLSKIYQVLHMGVNDPQNLYASIHSNLIKLFMQTIKLSSGDKTPPILDEKMMTRLNTSPTSKAIFIFFLELVWSLQIILSGVFGLFAIAKACQSYEKIMQILELLILQSKAKFNEENFQIMNLLQQQHSFKVIFFQVDRDARRNRENKYEGTLGKIEKVMTKQENAKMDAKKQADKQRTQLKKLQEKTIKVIGDIERQIYKKIWICPLAK